MRVRPMIWLRVGLTGSLLLYLLAPTLLVVVLSFGRDELIRFPPTLLSARWYQELFESPEWMDAARRSVVVGLATAVLAVALGTSAALALVRGRVPLRRTIELLSLAPMIVPPIVLAVGGYDIFLRLQLVGSLAGLVLLHTVLAVPFVVLIVSAALYRSDPALELASLSLGAGPVRTLRSVTLPILAPAMLVSGVFAFLTSFDEVVIAIFVLAGGEPTLPIRIFTSLTTGISPVVAAVAAMQIVFAALMLVLLALFRRLDPTTRPA